MLYRDGMTIHSTRTYRGSNGAYEDPSPVLFDTREDECRSQKSIEQGRLTGMWAPRKNAITCMTRQTKPVYSLNVVSYDYFRLLNINLRGLIGVMDTQNIVDAATTSASAKPYRVASNIMLQTPLSRKGKGPGLLIILPDDYKPQDQGKYKKTLDPEPLQKWAEEGFAVVEVKFVLDEMRSSKDMLARSLEALKEMPECVSDGGVGVIGTFLLVVMVQLRHYSLA
jgi:hypothetical protein